MNIEPDMILQGIPYVLASKVQKMLDDGAELERQFREMRELKLKWQARAASAESEAHALAQEKDALEADVGRLKDTIAGRDSIIGKVVAERDEARERLNAMASGVLDSRYDDPADTAANAAAAVQSIADDVRERFTDHPATRPGKAQEFVHDSGGIDPDCRAGTCDCTSKPVPTPRFDFEADEQRLVKLEQRADGAADCLLSIEKAAYGHRMDKLEQRQLAIDGEASGWREMVNGLRFALNDLDRVVGGLMERVNNLEDKQP